jgi:hypothetical protein
MERCVVGAGIEPGVDDGDRQSLSSLCRRKGDGGGGLPEPPRPVEWEYVVRRRTECADRSRFRHRFNDME